MKMGSSIQIVATLAAFLGALTAGRAQEFHPIDLSRFYTTTLAEEAAEPPKFPAGAQRFNKVPFQIGGRIDLTGMDAARRGSFQPTEVAGIPVNHKARRLHLLHGALRGTRAGGPLANVVLHYRNGETLALRLAFGVHAGNCFEDSDAAFAPLADPNSTIAWQRVTKGAVARVFHTPIDNPLPDEEIASLDFVSLFDRATPVLVAITLQDGASLAPLAPLPNTRVVERATEFSDETYRRVMAVRVLDAATGAALSNALVSITIGDDANTFFFGQHRTDASGAARIFYPPPHAAALHIRVSERGYATETVSFSALGGKPWPEQAEVRLQRGVPWRGLVVNTSGTPIANASVIPYELTQKSSNEFTRADLDLATTDDRGAWRVSVPTQLLEKISFEANHPDHHTAQVTLPPSAMRDGSAKIELRPHLQIAGRILNDAGAPLPRAFVTLIESDDERVTHTADEAGRFRFIIPEASDTPARLVVLAKNYAPRFQSVAGAVTNMEVKLTEGAPFSMQLTDARGGANAGVAVSLYRWNNVLSAFKWGTKTDEDGRFRWDNAPDGPVTFRFEKNGYSHYYSTTLPAKKELTFALRGQLRLGGKVVDAVTKRPVDALRVRGVFKKNGSTSSYSNTGRKGSFSMSFSGQSAADYDELTLTIDANGYETFTTNMPANFESSTNVYELKKAKMLEGVVLAPNGSPAAKAEVVLLEPNYSAYMDEPGRFRRNSSYFDVALVDENGRVELPAKTNADYVLAAHPQHGFAQMDAAEFRKSGRVTLQPWGAVKGVLRVGDRVEPNQFAAVHTHWVSEGGRRSSAPLFLYFKMAPEPDGRFLFDAVPPGERMVQLRYVQGGKDSGPFRLSHNVPITVKPGATNDVVIGGSGRMVVGRVSILGAAGVKIDGWRGQFALRSQPGAMPSEIPPPLIIPPSSTPAERQQLLKAHQEKIRQAATNRVRANRVLARTYFPLFDDNNKFTIPNVPPGRYTLDLQPYDPRQPSGTSRTLGSVTRTITVPDGTGEYDAGTVELKVRP